MSDPLPGNPKAPNKDDIQVRRNQASGNRRSAVIEADIVTIFQVPTNRVYVDIDPTIGNDTTGNGSIHKPFLTLQKAYTSIGDASTVTEFNNSGLRAYIVIPSPGVYTETDLSLPLRPYVMTLVDGVEIISNVKQDWTGTAFFTGALKNSQVIFKNSGGRAYSPGTDHPRSGITGNFTLTAAGGVGSNQIHFQNSGLLGNIQADGSALPCQLFLIHSNVGGDVIANSLDIKGWAIGGMNQPRVDDITGIGGVSGANAVSWVLLENVTFNNDCDFSLAEKGTWYNVRFQTSEDALPGIAVTFKDLTTQLEMDSNTRYNLDKVTAVMPTANIDLIDTALGVRFTPVNTNSAVEVQTAIANFAKRIAMAY